MNEKKQYAARNFAARKTFENADGSRVEDGDGQPLDINNDSAMAMLCEAATPEGRTDLANARRFKKLHGNDVFYCYPWRQWLLWDGRRWARDSSGGIMRLGKSVADYIWRSAKFLGDGAVTQFAAKSASDRSIKSMLELSKSDLPIMPDEMDQNEWLLNCSNGTLDLRTGELREHRREDRITKLCPIDYNPNAVTFRWDLFLDKTFAGREDLIKWVQKFVGYCLTGTVTEQILPIFHGVGANGKSTLLNVILELLGPDYSMQAVSDLLMASRGDKHPTERADLFGMRFVPCVEMEDNRTLAESLVKQLTGGDLIRARRMRQDFWQFRPTHKLALCTNHKPRIKGTDHAIWRRIRLIPFDVVIPDAEQDKNLADKLREELQGILTWAVEGCRAWQAEGLGMPEAVQTATDAYRTGQDVYAAFIAERCVLGDHVECKASRLYSIFKAWCERGGERAPNGRRFGEALTERGFGQRRSNGIIRTGIGILAGEWNDLE